MTIPVTEGTDTSYEGNSSEQAYNCLVSLKLSGFLGPVESFLKNITGAQSPLYRRIAMELHITSGLDTDSASNNLWECFARFKLFMRAAVLRSNDAVNEVNLDMLRSAGIGVYLPSNPEFCQYVAFETDQFPNMLFMLTRNPNIDGRRDTLLVIETKDSQNTVELLEQLEQKDNLFNAVSELTAMEKIPHALGIRIVEKSLLLESI